MTTTRPEFQAHDDFIFEHKKVGKVTREEFIKYVRSSHEHMRQLSELIQQYNQTIEDYLDEWDGNLESFDEDVKDLLGLWIQDGTMDHIINENLMSIKADKEYVDDLNENVTAQLAQTASKEELTASESRIRTDLSNIADGSPKGTFPTLSALNSAHPGGDTGIYIVAENGNWYYWGGNEWLSGGVYQSTGLSRGAVSINHLNIVNNNINIFSGGYDINTALGLNIGRIPLPHNLIQSTDGVVAIVPVTGGNTYHIRKFDDSNRFRAAGYTEKPYPTIEGMVAKYHFFSDDVATETSYFHGTYVISHEENHVEIRTPSDTNYIVVYVSALNETPLLQITENNDYDYFIPYRKIKREYLEQPLEKDVLTENTKDAISAQKLYITDWVRGNISPATGGSSIYNEGRAKTDSHILLNKGTKLTVNDPELTGIWVMKYDAKTKSFIGSSDAYLNQYTLDEDAYVKIVTRYPDEREITRDILNKLKRAVLCELSSRPVPESEKREIMNHIYFVNDWENGGLRTTDGLGTTTEGRVRTPLIPVRKGTKIIIKNDDELNSTKALLYYDFVTREYLNEFDFIGGSYTIKQDSYIRITTRFDDERPVPDLAVMNNRILVDMWVDSKTEERPYLFGNFTQLFKTNELEDLRDGAEFELSSSTITDLYNKYDLLMNKYPHIISKNLLGYGGNDEGVPDETLPIYEYIIEPPKDTGRGLRFRKPPLILIQGAIHGGEKAASWSTFEFFKQLLEDSAEKDNLSSIKSNVKFKILPILNPWGYNENNRQNARGVDLNRNFFYRWEQNSSDIKGTAPYSEVESPILRDWLIENNDAVLYLDYHNVGEQHNVSYFNTPNMDLNHSYQSVLMRLSDIWKSRYGRFTNHNNALGWLENNQWPVTFNEGIYVAGIKNSAILEIAWDEAGTRNTKQVLERGVDLLGNYLLMFLHQYNNNGL